ncbi:Asp23/Gls24 family envelope stress response protein [Lentilactobacillus senioris]|uniref:Asp23/Gls24 family envelope stress response protein n=1 Tax=Lentilactobacillus senioris TaxID=931534 RepID=UPI0006D25D04|nr:Asp23/Gls24 family envelope stress response protein [Lentilactobacillus senioris]
MAVKIKTQFGTVDIDNDVISTVVGGAATDNYGVVGMASRNQLRDNVNDILKRENYSRGGVVVTQNDNGISIDVYIIVSYGTKISEVSKNVQSKVKYNLESMLGGVTANSVNVIVQGVQVLAD